jgi:hypothetical protein
MTWLDPKKIEPNKETKCLVSPNKLVIILLFTKVSELIEQSEISVNMNEILSPNIVSTTTTGSKNASEIMDGRQSAAEQYCPATKLKGNETSDKYRAFIEKHFM